MREHQVSWKTLESQRGVTREIKTKRERSSDAPLTHRPYIPRPHSTAARKAFLRYYPLSSLTLPDPLSIRI